MKRLLTALFLAASFAFGASAPPPFTLQSALAGLAKSHPHATRVAEALPAGVRARENLTYARHRETDGGELQLDVYRPAAEKICPAVILIHGGGWIAGDRTMERSFAKQLAARGYVAVPVSYRLGEPGRFPNCILDLRSAIRWLRAHAAEHGIDPARLGAIGGSAGGMLSAFLGATNGLPEFAGEGPVVASLVQAVVDIDGVANFLDNALIAQSEGPPSPYYVFQHGTYRTARATWIAASPINYVGPHSAPTLFLKSTAPRPILPGRDEMAARLAIFKIDSAVVQFPDTPHVFWLFQPWFEKVVDESDRFLRRHLLP